MTTLPWPMVTLLVVLVICSSVLGVMHVLGADWIERTFTALLGLVVGHAMGVLRGRALERNGGPPH